MNVKNYRDLDHRFDSIMMQIIRITRAEQNLLRPEPVISFIVELGIYVEKNLLFGNRHTIINLSTVLIFTEDWLAGELSKKLPQSEL